MAQLENGNDELDWDERLNIVVDLDQCRTLCTTWNGEEEIEYGLHMAFPSVRRLNPVVVETETSKSIDSSGELTEETEIVSLGELFVVPEEIFPEPEGSKEPDVEDVLDPYTISESSFADSLENVVGAINTHLRLVFNEEGVDANCMEINSYMTATFTLTAEELISVVDPEHELDRTEVRQLLSQIATNEMVDSRMSVPEEHGNGHDRQKYAIERDLTMGLQRDSDVITPNVVIDTIDHIHNGVFNNKQTVALSLSIANNTDVRQAEIAAELGVNPSVISVQLQDAKDEIKRARHTTQKFDAGEFI
jgi:hypothetical protein